MGYESFSAHSTGRGRAGERRIVDVIMFTRNTSPLPTEDGADTAGTSIDARSHIVDGTLPNDPWFGGERFERISAQVLTRLMSIESPVCESVVGTAHNRTDANTATTDAASPEHDTPLCYGFRFPALGVRVKQYNLPAGPEWFALWEMPGDVR